MIAFLYNIIFLCLLDSDWLRTVPIILNRHGSRDFLKLKT